MSKCLLCGLEFADGLALYAHTENYHTPPRAREGALPEAPGAADMVNYPPHYVSHPSGVECITITRHMNFNLGNALKYIWRAGSKGSAIEDLKKAAFYINDEIKRLEKK